MSSSLGEETPKARLATAQAALALAIRLSAEVHAGRIRATIFQRSVAVVTGGPGVQLPPDYAASLDDLRKGSSNLVLIALGASALIADETLDEVFGQPAIDSASTRAGLRILVNQLRNAFAHNPWRPKWRINSKYRSIHLVKLATSEFEFDATDLHLDHVKPEQFGGLENWIRVLRHCESIVPN